MGGAGGQYYYIVNTARILTCVGLMMSLGDICDCVNDYIYIYLVTAIIFTFI